MTKSDIQNFRFCQKYFDENGGQKDKRPVWWESGTVLSEIQQHIFVSASWFSTWEKWQPEAERALTAALFEFDAFNGIFVKRGVSYPVSGEPHFYLEKADVWQGHYAIWINATCPSESEFLKTLDEAKEKIANNNRFMKGKTLAASFEPLKLLPVRSEWYQSRLRTVSALLEHL